MRNRVKIGAAAAVAAVALTASGCGASYDQAHNHNTGVGPYVAPENTVISFPYGFDNIARVCQDGDGVYVAFHGSVAAVVPHDQACTGK